MRSLLLILLISLVPSYGEAQIDALLGGLQNNEDTTTVADSSSAVTDTIQTPSDLIIAYEESAQTIREIRYDLLSGFQVKGIRDDYEELHETLLRYYEIDSAQVSKSTLSRVNDLIIIFERRNALLKDWQDQLIDYTSKLSNYRIELTKITGRLSVDSEMLDGAGIDYYNNRFLPLVNEADSLNGEINEKLQEILKIEYEVTQDFSVTSRRIESLRQYLRNYWKEVLQHESEAWKFRNTAVQKEDGQLGRTLWRITSFFIGYPYHTFVWLLIILGIYLGLKRIQPTDEAGSEGQDKFKIIYTSQLSVSLIIGAVLFPLVYPPTTTLMYDFLLMIAYIPFLMVLKNVVEPQYYRRYLIFFLVFLILKFQNLLLPLSGYSSIILMGCAFVFSYFILFTRMRKHFRVRWKWIRMFNYVLGITLLAGIILIVFSRLTLGKILINGAGETIAIAYILVFLGFWFDRFIEFIREKPRFVNISSNKEKLDDFWRKWHNRIYLLLFLLFSISLLRNFNLLNNVKLALVNFFTEERVLGDLTFTVGGISLFMIVIYISTQLSSTIKFLTEDKSYYRSQKQTANFTVILRFFVITVGFILALVVSGIDLDKIAIILGALSVGIGFGLQNIVNNLISGLILIFERPIQSGDIVEVQQYMGVVKDIGIRSSVIRTYDGSEIILPNGDLISQAVTNWTLSNQHRRVEVRVGVAYGSNAQQTQEVLGNVIADHNKILRLPQPLVLFDGFGDSSLDFRLLFWTSDIDSWLRTRSEIMTAIYDALAEAGIEIPFPQRDLHIRSWEPGASPGEKMTDHNPPDTGHSDSEETTDPKSTED